MQPTDNAPDQKPQKKGKTIFMEYSSWKPGQHFMTVLQTVPGDQEKVLIGKVTLVRSGDKYGFHATAPDGKTIALSDKLSEIKKTFKENGDELARLELERQRTVQQQAPAVPDEPSRRADANERAEEIKKLHAKKRTTSKRINR